MGRYLLVSLAIGIVATALALLLHLGTAGGSIVEWLFAGLSRSPAFPSTLDPQTVPYLQYAVIGLLAFGIAWATIDISVLGPKILIAAIAIALTFTLVPTLALYGIVFEPFSPALAGVASLLLGLFYGGTERGRRKALLEEMLGRRVSRGSLGRLLAAPDPLELGGEDRELAILTCRVFNHQELREKLEPGDLVDLTNMFLGATAEFLLDRGAYLDESAPDCVRVFFGMPERAEDEKSVVRDACLAALELRQRLANLATECERKWMHRPRCGVGLTLGTVTVGLYGSGAHTHYTGVGGQIDYCRRLCGKNADFGSMLLASDLVYQAMEKEFGFRPLARHYVEAQGAYHEIYELLDEVGALSEEDTARRDSFWNGVILFREKKFEAARSAFQSALDKSGDDPPLRHYLNLVSREMNTDDEEGEDDDQPAEQREGLRATTTL